MRLMATGQPLEECDVPTPRLGRSDILVRVGAAGICHSDVHYRAGTSPAGPLPITPGHEVAGTVQSVGEDVSAIGPSDRVCLHYMVTCGRCRYCVRGTEQFCLEGRMIGKNRDGGYAECIAVPDRGVVLLPESIPFDHAAVMMCSTATSYHALRKARLVMGETVAIFGAGGLGLSAVQLARALGAAEVYAIDVNRSRLDQAESLDATALDASKGNPLEMLEELTHGAGVDVSLELVGLPETMQQAVRALGVFGRAVLVGITQKPFSIASYHDLIGKEAEVIGGSDHLLSELPDLLSMTERGILDLSRVVTATVPLAAGPINEAMDALERFQGASRTVIVP